LQHAKYRCEKVEDVEYHNYGARGIKFDFPSIIDAGLYLIKLSGGFLDRNMEIDRIDTNGNYAPGNLRLVSRRMNCGNMRKTVLSRFEQKYWPYAYSTVIRKLSDGMTRDEIIENAKNSVINHKNGWGKIEARLKSMIYEMPEDIIVLPYRGS
jgi:hypothetical protein